MSAYVSFWVGVLFMLAGCWMLPPLVDWLGDRRAIPHGLLGLVVVCRHDGVLAHRCGRQLPSCRAAVTDPYTLLYA